MIIGISGTHFTNKTEIAERVFEILSNLGKRALLISEVTRKVKGRGFKLGKHATREARIFALKEQLAREREAKADYIILDRTALDSYSYLLYGVKSRHGKARANYDPELEKLRKAVAGQTQKYDYIFYIPITKKVDCDPDFQVEVACIIEEQLRKLKLNYRRLTGNPENDALEIVKIATGYEKTHLLPMIAGEREAFINKKTGHAIIREELRIPQKLLEETYGGNRK